MSSFTVLAPQRLDVFLSSQEEAASRTSAQRLIRDGRVMVNGKIVKKPAYVLQTGDIISVAASSFPSAGSGQAAQDDTVEIEPADLHLAVLYEDDACLIINKPAGIAVHPAASMKEDEKTILNGIAFLFRIQSIPLSSGAVLVHRLDKDTTGCLLIAKNVESHAALQKQFEERTVQKKYLAIVAGTPDPPSAIIDAPVGRNLLDRMKMSILRTGKSREARTTYRTLSTGSDCALLACDLHTGRTHQIRVHLSSIGHPILGDAKYDSSVSESMAKQYGIKNLCLHAWKLAFTSFDGQQQNITAPIPEAFLTALQAVGITPPAALAD